MSGQFNRQATITFSDGTTSFDVSGLKVQFTVTKQVSHFANLCDLRVYNLKEATRNRISGTSTTDEGFQHVTLKVGYGEGSLTLLFDGDIRNVYHRREGGPDIVTVCYCADGDRYTKENTSAYSWGAGSKAIDILSKLVADMNIPIGEINTNLGGDIIGASGFAYNGKTEDCLNKLADKYRFNWYVLNGKFYAVGENKTLLQFPINNISQTTGMIGSPTITEIGMQVKTLLNPQLAPGARVSVSSVGTITDFQNMNFYSTKAITESTSIDDRQFKILRAVHTGDTRGNEWYSEIETQANWQTKNTSF